MYKPSTEDLTKKIIDLSDTLYTHIEDNAFKDDSILEMIIFPKGLTNIGRSSFEGCINLNKIENIDPVIIYQSAFARCSRLEKIDLQNVTLLDQSVFQGCTNLYSINIPNVVEIKFFTFEGCSQLSVINMSSITKIGHNAFQNCEKLEYIIFIRLNIYLMTVFLIV